MGSRARTIPWIRIVAEGGAIVVSILLALAVDAWWEDRSRRAQEAIELSRLSEESTTILRGIRQDLVFQERLITHTSRVLQAMREAAVGAPVTLPDSLALMLLFAPTWETPSITQDALIASGRLALISDREVRGWIAGWSAALSGARENQDRARRFYEEELLPVLRTSGDITNLLRNRAILPTTVDAVPSEWAAGETTVSNSLELQNLVAQKVLFATLALRSSESAISALQRLVEVIEEVQGGPG
ncbi:MAG: hypothetical protein R3223_05170 [Longimicrobiales bacterium]|nr:hypothetical protein [Longimicrobiales bacterium]